MVTNTDLELDDGVLVGLIANLEVVHALEVEGPTRIIIDRVDHILGLEKDPGLGIALDRTPENVRVQENNRGPKDDPDPKKTQGLKVDHGPKIVRGLKVVQGLEIDRDPKNVTQIIRGAKNDP